MKNIVKLFGNFNRAQSAKVPLLNLNRAQSAKVPLLIIALVAVIGLSFAGCDTGGGSFSPSAGEQPQKQPDTPRTLSFGTPACKVTIKSADQFTAAEWKTLCDKVVAAIKRGYGAAPSAGVKAGIENFFMNNTVSVVLLKSATLDCEVKSDETGIMYLKANGSTIDGISASNLLDAIFAIMGTGESYPTS